MSGLAAFKAAHQIISDSDRELHGDETALQLAFDRIRREYDKHKDSWPPGSRFHVVMTIEAPEKSK